MRGLAVWVAVLLAVGVVPADARECGVPADLHDGWAIADPTVEGLDPALVCAIGTRFENWREADPHAVIVVRHGVLAYEHYFTGEDERWGRPLGRIAFDARTKHDLQSITKSVTSLLVGIAFDRGSLTDLDASVFSFLPEYADLRTPDKDRITLRDLLTMSSGLAWDETILPYENPLNSSARMGAASDPYRYVLQQPLSAPPGTRWNYNGGGTALLGLIVKKVSGQPLDALAREALFTPLGIEDWEWRHAPNGNPTAASGLRLRPRDLAKIGQLLLARGAWQGKQVVPAGWIDQATAPRITGEGMLFGGFEGLAAYGYQWWTGRSSINHRDIDWVAGVGLGGQRLYVAPKDDLVVVVTAGDYRGPYQGLAGGTALNTFVLPAVKP